MQEHEAQRHLRAHEQVPGVPPLPADTERCWCLEGGAEVNRRGESRGSQTDENANEKRDPERECRDRPSCAQIDLDGNLDGHVQLRYEPNNQEPKQRLLHELRSLLGRTGMHQHHLIPRHAYLKNDIPVAGCAHQAGTCRFGSDPASSVLDRDCRAHEVDNLYVVDTSFFPSIGAVNPALTAMANALRVGDHLLEWLGASSNREAVGSGAGRAN